MTIQPTNLDDLRKILADASARGEKVGAINVCALDRVVEHSPEDLTVTVEAGVTLATLQAQLTQRGQWLPIDAPRPDSLTIGALLATNASGPRRFGCGTVRDYLIGIKVALTDGRLIKSGGKVVKNVAGYDLSKLFVGSRGSLGVIVEATFKLQPVPEVEQFVQAHCESLENAGMLLEGVVAANVTPVVLDLHNLRLHLPQRLPAFSLVLGFAGTREEVEWQLGCAAELGFKEPSSLDYEKDFRSGELPSPHRVSVLPSRLIETIRGLPNAPFVARAGNGVIYWRGEAIPPKNGRPIELTRRVKAAFDPKHILPELPP